MVGPLAHVELQARVERLEAAVEEILRRLGAQQEAEQPKAPEKAAPGKARAEAQQERPHEVRVEPQEEELPAGQESKSGPSASISSLSVKPETRVEGEIAEEGHEVKPSIWDAAIFIGVPGLRRGHSCVLVTLLLINIVGQLVLALTVGFAPNNFINNSLPSVEALRSWRALEAQSLDRLYGSISLARRVCQKDSSLSIAGPQVDSVKDVEAYLKNSRIVGLPSGSVLCIFVLLLWWLVVFGELVEILNFTLGIVALPRRRETHLVRTHDGSFAFRSLGLRRYAGLLALVLVRFAVAALLLVLGSVWLACTANLEAMVLNAAALSFVMDFDDLLFRAFGPPRAKALVGRLERLPASKVRLNRAALLGFIAVVLGAWLVPTKMWDMVGTLRNMDDALCGGDQDFVFTTHPAMHFVQVAPTKPDNSGSEYVNSTALAVYKYAQRADPDQVVEPLIGDSSLVELISDQELSVSELVSGLICEDQREWLRSVLITVRAVTGDSAAESCADLRDKCDAWVLVRALCPRTCGCAAPRGLKFRKGCPAACALGEEYRQALQALPCTDMTREQILAEPGGRALEEEYGHAECNRTTLNQCLPPSETVFGSFLYYCPRACGCVGAQGSRGCPPACT